MLFRCLRFNWFAFVWLCCGVLVFVLNEQTPNVYGFVFLYFLLLLSLYLCYDISLAESTLFLECHNVSCRKIKTAP